MYKRYVVSNQRLQSFFPSIIMFLFIVLMLNNQPGYAQGSFAFGVSGGYTDFAMKDVNNDLHDTYDFLIDEGFPAQGAVNVSGGFLFTANVMYKPNRLSYGLVLHVLSSKGNVGYRDATGVIEEMYTAKSIEVEAAARYMYPLNKNIALFGQLGAGYGSATGTHFSHFEIFDDQQYTIRADDDVSGGYFAGHVQAGVEFRFRPFSFGVYSGYRFANAGALMGPHVYNGITYINSTIKNMNGSDIDFDYSGVMVGFFVTYEFAL